MKVSVIEPHGFCAGVTAALRKALELADEEGSEQSARRLYCLHQLVHNEIVVGELKQRGFSFVESLDEVPDGSTVLFSAHGVSPSVRERAGERGLTVVDATCPFVRKVHDAARAFAAKGLPVVVIGNPAHAEVQGIVGEVEAIGNSESLVLGSSSDSALKLPRSFGLVSQTTMNADEVKEIAAKLKRTYEVETMAEVCNATKVRQDAVKAFEGDAVLVLGSANSSNTRRLCEVARVRALRAGTMVEVQSLDFSGIRELGVTSGASTPESFFSEAVAWLKGNRE